eukprot:8455436-Alexandrium_andersonii.AAC.1
MSASLVGSEMCIRDRTGIRPCVDTFRARESGTATSAQRGLQAFAPQREPCLLYTSDAADDM